MMSYIIYSASKAEHFWKSDHNIDDNLTYFLPVPRSMIKQPMRSFILEMHTDSRFQGGSGPITKTDDVVLIFEKEGRREDIRGD